MPAFKKALKKIGRGIRGIVKLCFRIAVFLVLLVVLAAGAAVLFVQYMVSPEALKTILTAQIQEAFHRPVEIQEVKFNVYQGIRVKGLQILETADFGGGTLLSGDYLVAKYDWKELLHKRLDFEHVTIVAPRIQLAKSLDGRWNWEEILTSSTSLRSRELSPQIPLPVALFAHVISIEHGAITIKDLKRDRLIAFQGVDLTVRNFDVEKTFSVTASFDNNQEFWNGKVRSRGSLRGSVSLAGLHLDQAVFRAEDLEVKSGGLTARGSLLVKDFVHPRIEASLRLPALDSRHLSQYHPVPSGLDIPASRWKARLSFPEEGQWQVDSLTGTAGALKLQANGSLRISKESKPFHLAWNMPTTSLKEAASVWEGLRQHELSGRAAVNGDLVGDLMDLEHTLAVQQASLNLQDFGGVFFKDSRLAHVDAELSGTRNFETLSVTVSKGALTTFGNLFSGLDFAAKIKKGDLAFERFNGTWGMSHFKLNGLIAHLAAPREIHVDGSVDTLRLDYAIDAFLKLLDQLKARHPHPMTRAGRLWSQVFKYSIPKSFPATSGHVRFGEVIYPAFQTFNLDAQWDLRGISTGLKQSNGNVRIGFGPGRVTDIPALENQDPHNILRIVFLPFVFMHRMERLAVISAATAYPKSLDFNRIEGDYGVKRGVADVRLFRVDSGSLLAFADGTVDFPQEKVDLHILTRMTESRGPLPEYLTDEKGRPSIGFYVQDNLNTPTPRLEYRKMAADAIETSVQKGKDRGRGIFPESKGEKK